MITIPCQNCKDRTIPKTCETNCLKWIKYKKELEQAKQLSKLDKQMSSDTKLRRVRCR